MSKSYTGLTTNGVTELTLQEEGGNIGTQTIVWDSTQGTIDQVIGAIPDYWKAGYDTIKQLQIGTSCTSIGSYAFNFCTGFTGPLVIPDSVTSIGSYSFNYCYDSNNDTGFSGDLVIPDSVTSIGSYSFYYCYKMEGTLTIGNSVTTIGSGAFAYNSFSGDLVIPNSVTSMGEDAFADNTNAFTGSLTLSQNPSFTAIPRRAFINTPFTGTLNIPDNITTIDFQSFGATNFSTIVIPDSITYIGTALSFSSNTGLTTVYTACPASSWDSGAINSGVGNAFSGCDNLTNIYVHADQLASYDAAWRADQSVAAGATVSTWTNYPNIP
tara:strand:+ start:96 stop:1070 length:975 start_codon:yes stop_codon:yes gene_type:complete